MFHQINWVEVSVVVMVLVFGVLYLFDTTPTPPIDHSMRDWKSGLK